VTSFLYALIEAPQRLLHYVVVIAGMAILRCTYAIYRTRNLSFLLFVFYGFLHLGLLVPLRIRALVTLNDNSWGTRTLSGSRAAAGS
jgi:hyaluronan synthase/N-acetylglucosaminyltransferase